MGIDILAVTLSAIVSGLAGGTWVASKVMERQQERLQNLHQNIELERQRINALDSRIDQLPHDYVLKADFLRELEGMHDNFKLIHAKLDKLMEKILAK
jgi:uncharacterized protein YneF (UPF0154 family)|tara:strand:+ start:91 stop:384 length:294 start_codon:yes stop_codon:yes gene_type:complete